MSTINVLVAFIPRDPSPDLKAKFIYDAVASRPDMRLWKPYVVPADRVFELLDSIPLSPPCALVLVGSPADTVGPARRWLEERADLVVLRVDVVGDFVQFTLRDPRLESLVSALRGLVDRVQSRDERRSPRIQLLSVGTPAESRTPATDDAPPQRPLLQAARDWVHELLRDAVECVPLDKNDKHGLFSFTQATLLQSLDEPSERSAVDVPPELARADAALTRAHGEAGASSEPLARAASVFGLKPLEFRMLALALAPELDPRFQRCAGFLLDEMGRRVGTPTLYAALLGAPTRVRGELAHLGALAEWQVFDGNGGRQPAADEPLRLDPFLAAWLLGERSALSEDPRVRRAMRLDPWPGATLLELQEDERSNAATFVASLRESSETRWTLLSGGDPAGWRARIELGARTQIVKPLRIEIARVAALDMLEIEDCARRIGRLARLREDLLVIDATNSNDTADQDDRLRLFLASLERAQCRPAVICDDVARMIRLLGTRSCQPIHSAVLPMTARIAVVRAAATGAGACLSEREAEAIATQYPIRVDGLEHAMHLALSRSLTSDVTTTAGERFIAACKQVASEGVSGLAERIEPIFDLDEVVLPSDRKLQLTEIVDNIRLAPRVLDEWKFRAKLPYGRGVSALFCGPSGTGKTMAAMGVARRLGIQLLRFDLSKIISKYIGDTEKNIDRLFSDAQGSGSAILIDEADALLGKRSEVKDAHDRYANIEVAYLLQRMEAYEGLAILTTNLRQNLDSAFLRRLRFIVDFPRPDVDARDKIWRQCLPEGSHELDDAAFRQLARKIDLTGGHIRQITLRAAFIAAAADAQICLVHISQAARAEFAKLGMPSVELDLSDRKKVA